MSAETLLCSHGSRSVMFMGQTSKTIPGETLYKSVEEQGGTVSASISHELEVCFMNSGHFSIYLLWKDHPSSTTWFSTLKPIGLEVFAP